MTRRTDLPEDTRRRDHITFAACVAVLVGFAVLAMFDVPERHDPQPGQDICKTEGC